MPTMQSLTISQNSINITFAPKAKDLTPTNCQGLRSLGSIFESLQNRRTKHNIQFNSCNSNNLRTNVLGKSKLTFLVVSLLVSLVNCNSALANQTRPIPTDLAVRAILGEASNQGYEGMFAVACAIRNRGSLKGVYGLSANHVKDEPEKVRLMALTAWQNSIIVKFPNQDPTHGATNWENIHAFGKPSWAYSMIQTAVIKDHVFYREAK